MPLFSVYVCNLLSSSGPGSVIPYGSTTFPLLQINLDFLVNDFTCQMQQYTVYNRGNYVCMRSSFSCVYLVSRCEQCGCDPAGSFNGSCHAETGQCPCKLFVTGEKCEQCVEGASHMDPANHLGCSKGHNSEHIFICSSICRYGLLCEIV